MTYSNQEVPSWNIYDSEMYLTTFPELLTEEDKYFFDQDEIKPEDTYSPVYQPTTQASMLASPSMNMPVLCQAYNPYSPAAQSIMQASPSNTFAHSPGSSTYSASPINSPQQAIPPEDFMRYGMRQNFRHALPQTQDYGYFYNDYTGNKRRKRDEELTNEEYEKRRLRRERNKQAALRCRTRRRERIDALEQETSQIEEDNEKVEKEILGLRKQLCELKELLKEHKCSKQINLNDVQQSKVSEVAVKPEPQ